jgi:hypothetical protein
VIRTSLSDEAEARLRVGLDDAAPPAA